MEFVFDIADLRLVPEPRIPSGVDLLYEPHSLPRNSGYAPFSPPPLLDISDEEDVQRQVKELLLKPAPLDLPVVTTDAFDFLRTEVHPPLLELKAIRDFETGEIKGVVEVPPAAYDTATVDFDKVLSKPPGFAYEIDFGRTVTTTVDQPALDESKLDFKDLLESLPNLRDVVHDDKQQAGDSEKKIELDEIEHVNEIPQVEISEVLEISKTTTERTHTKWAEVVSIYEPVTNYNELNPQPAYSWPFELDTFQKKAILLMEKGENVFVSAHTSAGKTVVAEYAVALSRKHLSKAIYTSPIKTLSNEKFRDFKENFDDVGIITGDVQINRDASMLIMTTEILRSMLYNKAPIIDDLEWVIFDECHYINDAERGVVWEEVLIMLPQHVNLVLLSATVPNALDLADWIGRIKKSKIHVIATTKRPVPLEHYLYVGRIGATKEQKEMLKQKATPEPVKLPDQAVLIVDSKGQFKSQNYLQVCAAKRASSNHWKAPDEKARFMSLVKYLKGKDDFPAIVFTLSRNRCDENAESLSNLDLTHESEKRQIHRFIANSTARLSVGDRKLPQIVALQRLLKNGIGVHHSGILPIMKEVVEILFKRGLIKLLFATETFAMGVNMPARTVVFDRIRKYDGCQFRDLLPAEYIQMAGRAGRRGTDTVGTVLIMINKDVPDSSSLQVMMMGKPQCLHSKFKITDTMILNLKAGSQRRVEDIMRDSFSEDAKQSQLEGLVRKREELSQTLANTEKLDCNSCHDIEECLEHLDELSKIRKQLFHTILLEFSGSTGKLFSPGRVIVFCKAGESPRLGAITTFANNQLTVISLAEKKQGHCYWPASKTVTTSQNSKCELVTVTAAEILDFSTTEIRISVKTLSTPKSIREAGQVVFEMTEQWQFTKATLTKEIKGASLDLADLILKVNSLEKTILSHSCASCILFENHLEIKKNYIAIQNDLEQVSHSLSEEGMEMAAEYQRHLRVLEHFGYLEQDGTLKLKGRIARTMSTHEVMLTELLIRSILIKCKPAELAALLSVFVYQGKSEENESAEIPEEVSEALQRFEAAALEVGQVRRECGFEEDPTEFVEQFNKGIINVVYHWACGETFGEIMNIAGDLKEGTIVRCIQRLYELLAHVRDAAKIIGNPELHQKVEEASTLIRRDIVFAASLYLE